MMAIVIRYLLICIPSIACCKGQALRPEIARLAADIAADHFHVSKHIGFTGSTTDQWRRYDTLRNSATREELIALTDHPGACTRCYALDALIDRRDAAIYRIVLQHLHDTDTVETFAGCNMGEHLVGDYFLNAATACHYGLCVLDTAKRCALDSMMIFDGSIRLEEKSRLLLSLGPDPAYYGAIRELAERHNDGVGVIALAKYRKGRDRQFIVRKLSSSSIQDQYYGLWAVRHYPDSSFFPYLVEIHTAEVRQGACYNWMLLRALYEAVLRYRHDAAHTLLVSTMAMAKDNPALKQHVVFIGNGLIHFEDSDSSRPQPDPPIYESSPRRLRFDSSRQCD